MAIKKLSVVIPTFNEAGNIDMLLEEIDTALWRIPYEIIFVDDSTDSTPELLKKAAQGDGRIRFEHREGGSGLATAVLRGFELASGDYIAVMDADLQHPPAVLRYMYCALRRGADICIPSRFIPGGSDGGLDFYRKAVSGTARYIGKFFLRCLRRISDPTSGLFMFRRSILAGARLKPVGWKIMIEVLAMCSYSRVTELPYTFQSRNAGESKLSGKATLEYLRQVFSLIPRAARNRVNVVRWSPARLKLEIQELNSRLDIQ